MLVKNIVLKINVVRKSRNIDSLANLQERHVEFDSVGSAAEGSRGKGRGEAAERRGGEAAQGGRGEAAEGNAVSFQAILEVPYQAYR